MSSAFAESIYTKSLESVDKTQKKVSKTWKNFIGEVDSFFVNEEFEEDINDSYIRVNYRITLEEDMKEKVEADIKIRAKFPRISKKANLILEKVDSTITDETSLLTNDDESIERNEAGEAFKNNSYAAALRFFVTEKDQWNISTDVGMRIDVPFDPFVKLRLKRTYNFKKHEFTFIQKFSYFRIDELSQNTAFVWTKDVGGGDKIKFETDIGWQEIDPDFKGDHILSYLQKLSKRRAISYSIGASYIIEQAAYYDQYQFATNYRQLIFKDWVFLQGAVGTIFRKEDEFKSSEYISLAFDLIF